MYPVVSREIRSRKVQFKSSWGLRAVVKWEIRGILALWPPIVGRVRFQWLDSRLLVVDQHDIPCSSLSCYLVVELQLYIRVAAHSFSIFLKQFGSSVFQLSLSFNSFSLWGTLSPLFLASSLPWRSNKLMGEQQFIHVFKILFPNRSSSSNTFYRGTWG